MRDADPTAIEASDIISLYLIELWIASYACPDILNSLYPDFIAPLNPLNAGIASNAPYWTVLFVPGTVAGVLRPNANALTDSSALCDGLKFLALDASAAILEPCLASYRDWTNLGCSLKASEAALNPPLNCDDFFKNLFYILAAS